MTGAHLRYGASCGHIERRRAAPESKYLGQTPAARRRTPAEIPRPAAGGQAKLGMTAVVLQPFHFNMDCTESQMRPNDRFTSRKTGKRPGIS